MILIYTKTFNEIEDKNTEDLKKLAEWNALATKSFVVA
jgi:hypothetical protein